MSVIPVPFQVDPVPNANQVGPGWIAAVIVLALIVGTLLLWQNMRKQLTKIDFEEEPTKADQEPPAQSR